MGLPEFAPAAQDPQREQSGNRPGAVDEHVAHAALTGGNESLMEFIGRRVEHRRPQGNTRFRPEPGAGVVPERLAMGAPDQQRQHGVFSQMRAFPDHQDNGSECFRRQIGHEPMQEGFQDARRMLK